MPAAVGEAPRSGAPEESEEQEAAKKALLATPPFVVVSSAPVMPYVFTGDLQDLPAPQPWREGEPMKVRPDREFLKPGPLSRYVLEPFHDPLVDLQLEVGSPLQIDAFTTPTRNFPGQAFTGVTPPDSVGDVGPNHYIQMVNDSGGSIVSIFNKATPTPTLIASFTLGSLAGGSSECSVGLGDPIVLYDQFAGRWLLAEIAASEIDLCVYISRTSDPVSGGWNVYDFTTPFPDYPKYGIWPTDANGGQGSYVATANDGGPGIFAMNRGAMLAGTSASFQRVSIPPLPGFSFQAPTPADADGATPPPPLAPAVFMRHRDTEIHSGPPATGDLLEMWLFNVNWTSPASSTLITAPSINVTDFDSTLCGQESASCIPQPGASPSLDPLNEIIMHRLQYRKFASYEALVGNFVVDAGTDRAGVRWFEARKTGSTWALYQEGTYSPDANNRWIGSIAMDQAGDIALAYNVSSTTVFPSLRYTGRLVGDTLGVMTQAESVVHTGTAANNPGFAGNRYGDYASMNVDPTDDCTFWFTGEDNTAPTWRTQIASFRFDSCACTAPAAPSLIAPPDAATGVTLSAVLDWSDVTGATSYDVQVATDPGFVSIARSATALPSSTWTVSPALAAATTYYWRARAVGSCGAGAWSAARSFTTCSTPAVPSLVSPAAGSVLSTGNPTLDWTDVAGATYDVQIATDTAFTILVRQIFGLTASTVTVTPALNPSATYYWRVRSAGCVTSAWSPSRSFQIGCLPASATYDATLRVPRCSAAACGCSTGTLAESRDNILGRAELNQPNTIGSTCPDGTSGTYHSLTNGESVDKIVVGTLDGSPLRPGVTVKIDATVWCRGTPQPLTHMLDDDSTIIGRAPTASPDYIDLYYAPDANSPSWTPVATSFQCSYGETSVFSTTLPLANVAGVHAIRAQIRFGGSVSPCTAGIYNDRDDVAFRVDPPAQTAGPLEAGYGHSVATNTDSSAWGWGWNRDGELGDGTNTNRNAPVRAGNLTGIVAMAAGVFHTIALKSDGTVWTWGGNADGQLGNGTTVGRSTPGQVPGLTGVIAIAAGASFSMALKSDGTVWVWGDNWGGQLGDGTTTDRPTPFQVSGISSVIAIAGGFYHSVAVKSDHTVWTWGRNAEGELGDGSHTDRFTPGPVPGLQGVRSVGCGAYFTEAVLEDGTIRGWGHNWFGQLGDQSNTERTTPTPPIPALSDVVAVAPGSGFLLVLRSDGTVWSAGDNVAGELGDGTTNPRNFLGMVSGLPAIVAIAGGEDHSLARAADGRIYGWGKNLYGQVGPGPSPQLTPVLITNLSVPPPLALMSPLGGETWQAGSSQVVSWTGAGPIKVDMAVDGVNWTNLIPSTTLQDVPITVPAGWTSSRALLRIVRVGTPASSAQTSPPLHVVLPPQHPWLVTTVDPSAAITGEYASIAIDPVGRTWIAYFDRTNGDLMVASRSAFGWAIETVDSANTSGWFTSIAFGTDGNPRISYIDGTRHEVRYASRSGTVWTKEDVSPVGCTLKGTLGLDTQNRPYIAFQDCTPSTLVRVLHKGPSGWTQIYQTIGASPTLKMQGDLPRIAFFNHQANPTQLRFVSTSGSYGSWIWGTPETVPGSDGATTSSLALDGAGNPSIAFYASKSLRLAKKAGASWSVLTVDASAGDVGDWNSIALDAAGNPRISYHANGVLKFAEWNGSAWLLDVPDAAYETGTSTSLAIDAFGNSRIAEFDAANGNLKYALSQPDQTAPASPILSPQSGHTTAAATWFAPGDDGQSGGPAGAYDLRWSQQPIDEWSFDAATRIGASGPGFPGTSECGGAMGLNTCSPYYFALRVVDDAGNVSVLSTVGFATDCSGNPMELLCE